MSSNKLREELEESKRLVEELRSRLKLSEESVRKVESERGIKHTLERKNMELERELAVSVIRLQSPYSLQSRAISNNYEYCVVSDQ